MDEVGVDVGGIEGATSRSLVEVAIIVEGALNDADVIPFLEVGIEGPARYVRCKYGTTWLP